VLLVAAVAVASVFLARDAMAADPLSIIRSKWRAHAQLGSSRRICDLQVNARRRSRRSPVASR
jgi:hypothetical protein